MFMGNLLSGKMDKELGEEETRTTKSKRRLTSLGLAVTQKIYSREWQKRPPELQPDPD